MPMVLREKAVGMAGKLQKPARESAIRSFPQPQQSLQFLPITSGPISAFPCDTAHRGFDRPFRGKELKRNVS